MIHHRGYLLLAACAGVAAAATMTFRASAQTTVAHWTFDTANITTSGSSITAAADLTGLHNATTEVGGAAPPINTVAGQFGQAAEFTNANANAVAQVDYSWMSFPQLTEISGPTAGNFSVATWAKVPDQTSWDDNPILADWGNAAAGTRRFTYWFQLDNVDGNASLRPRAQLRAANTPVDPANIDIVATTLNVDQANNPDDLGPTMFDDDVWRHLAWTWTKDTGEMRFYTDGLLRHTQTSTQPIENRNLLVSDSAVGAIGAKRDNNRYFTGALDELWVFTGVLTDAQVLNLKNTNAPGPGGGGGNVADFNGVGGVDGDDLTILRTNFGLSAGATKAMGDADLDGAVDGDDFLIWQSNFGATAVAASVAAPEPSTLAMLVVLGGLLAARRGRIC